MDRAERDNLSSSAWRLKIQDTTQNFIPNPEVPLGYDPDWDNPLFQREPENFIERFIYLQGITEVPKIYYRFVAFSLLSAILQNRVWLELSPGNPLYPNLYTFLLGPSGVGKGQAIGAGLRLLDSCGLSEYCGLLSGSLTSAALIDFLCSKTGQGIGGSSRAYVVNPEFASSVKWGDHADALVKRMTDLFTADLTNYTDMTRGSGIKKAGRPCVSWIAGSTREWLVSNIRADSLGGGFMARGLFVEAFSKNPNVFLPIPPPDYDSVFVTLQFQLIDKIQNLQGQFKINREAAKYLREWYMARVPPASEAALASWNRHRELALKVALLLCAGSPSTTQVINRNHLYEAISLVEEVKATESTLWTYITKGGRLSSVDWVAERIKRAGTIDHSTLLAYTASGRGIMAKQLSEIVSTLENTGKVISSKAERILKTGESAKVTKTTYTWTASRPSLVETDSDYD